MAKENKHAREEIKIVRCKECKRELDEMGCIVTCKYDNGTGSRDPKTLEMVVYVFDRVEPYRVK